MAVGWVAAFKTIPWAKVLSYAPLILQSATKLWNSVAKKQPQTPLLESQQQGKTLSAIEARLSSLEQQTSQLRDEIVSSSELIKSLAEQNAELVQTVDILRKRTHVLLWACGLTALAVVVLFFLLFAR